MMDTPEKNGSKPAGLDGSAEVKVMNVSQSNWLFMLLMIAINHALEQSSRLISQGTGINMDQKKKR